MENQTEQSSNSTTNNEESGKVVSLNQRKLDRFMEKLRQEQNLPMGVIAGLIAALVGALLWAAITIATEYQIGYMAVAIGFLVGFTMRFAGKGIDQIFGVIGAVLALLGCLLGNFFTIIGLVANTENLGYLETLSMLDFAMIPDIMMESFSPIDLLFYGIAIYEGYKLAFRPITDEELIDNATE